nr:tumor necrosis factor ligand superfamily member 6 isoform X1 [Misgurnus anguillicaudatus]
MAENGGVDERRPQVFVVSSQTLDVPTPPHHVHEKLNAHRFSLIYLLLGVALLGVFIEAGLIFHLYSRLQSQVPPDNQQVEYIKADIHSPGSGSLDHNKIFPENQGPESKPATFLQYKKSSAEQETEVLHWTHNVFPTFYSNLDIKNNSVLYIKQEGVYYIFSKISYQMNSFLKHQVIYCTERYAKHMELMSSRYFSNPHKGQKEYSNSYLGGVFQLYEGDSVFVKVNNLSLLYEETAENFFGAFKIH